MIVHAKIVAALALALAATLAEAQLRSLPAEAKRGKLTHVQGMQVELDGKPRQLSPGAQIRDRANFIVLPAALPPRSLVKFTRDATGNLNRVWILSEQEAAERDPPRK